MIKAFRVHIDFKKIGYQFQSIDFHLKDHSKKQAIIEYLKTNPHVYDIMSMNIGWNEIGIQAIVKDSNDLMAIGAYRFAHEKGLRIPDQLSIVGFDDIRLAAYANPPLTTIRQSKHTMGASAAKLLLERMTCVSGGNRRDESNRAV